MTSHGFPWDVCFLRQCNPDNIHLTFRSTEYKDSIKPVVQSGNSVNGILLLLNLKQIKLTNQNP